MWSDKLRLTAHDLGRHGEYSCWLGEVLTELGVSIQGATLTQLGGHRAAHQREPSDFFGTPEDRYYINPIKLGKLMAVVDIRRWAWAMTAVLRPLANTVHIDQTVTWLRSMLNYFEDREWSVAGLGRWRGACRRYLSDSKGPGPASPLRLKGIIQSAEYMLEAISALNLMAPEYVKKCGRAAEAAMLALGPHCNGNELRLGLVEGWERRSQDLLPAALIAPAWTMQQEKKGHRAASLCAEENILAAMRPVVVSAGISDTDDDTVFTLREYADALGDDLDDASIARLICAISASGPHRRRAAWTLGAVLHELLPPSPSMWKLCMEVKYTVDPASPEWRHLGESALKAILAYIEWASYRHRGALAGRHASESRCRMAAGMAFIASEMARCLDPHECPIISDKDVQRMEAVRMALAPLAQCLHDEEQGGIYIGGEGSYACCVRSLLLDKWEVAPDKVNGE